MMELIDKFDQTPEAARADLVAEMRKRKGNPIYDRYSTPAHRNFCFMGFAFETLRRKVPDALCWGNEGQNQGATFGPYPCAKPPDGYHGYYPKFSFALGMVAKWLGLNEEALRVIEGASDDCGYSWSQLADMLEEYQ